jgi:hypothetical protein
MRLKAACHIHSEWSYDARWKLQQLAGEFARRGYRVLLMTDHDRGFSETRRLQHREACAQASSDEILLIPGIEYSDATNTVHTLTWGQVPFIGQDLPTLQVLKAVKDAGGLAVMAHPARRQAWKSFEPCWGDYLLGMELWNRKADGWAPSNDAQRLMEGTRILPFACLDFHAINQMFPLSMEIEVSSRICEESVLDALRQRACRAMFFSEPLEDVVHSWSRLALEPAEMVRRRGASVYRWLSSHLR